MGKIFDFVKKSYYEYSSDQSSLASLLQTFFVFAIFLVLVPAFLSYATVGALLIKTGLETAVTSTDGLISQGGQWIIYGLVFGMATSMLIQSIQRKDQSPHQLLTTLIHHFFYFLVILFSIGFWAVILIIVS